MSSVLKSEDVEDPLEVMLKRTGCMELHFKVQECIAENQDWRKCQNEVKNFRLCMEKHNKKKS